ncbi:hypothetical protein R1sor_007354 [Riccia sorocarpa]|uniref:Uncharacterized protein n=1 Tax=Riccia sorocarpa TaxID=122646 RepID=A0ABD3HQM6_9MARC
MDVGAGPSERESEEERIRRELEILFGPDVSSDSIGSEEEAVNTENWPPVTSLSPEELYYHLETEGLLRLPLTIEKLIPLDDNIAERCGRECIERESVIDALGAGHGQFEVDLVINLRIWWIENESRLVFICERELAAASRYLERLFGPEVGTEEELLETEANVEGFPSATSLEPEELYSYLDGEDLLRLPVTVRELIPGQDEAFADDPSFWGSWRSKKVVLVRDHDCADRIRYKTETVHIEEDEEEVFVSRIWSGDEVPPLIGFGTLLEGRDGAYRAGIEVGLSGFRHADPRDGVLFGTTL